MALSKCFALPGPPCLTQGCCWGEWLPAAVATAAMSPAENGMDVGSPDLWLEPLHLKVISSTFFP